MQLLGWVSAAHASLHCLWVSCQMAGWACTALCAYVLCAAPRRAGWQGPRLCAAAQEGSHGADGGDAAEVSEVQCFPSLRHASDAQCGRSAAEGSSCSCAAFCRRTCQGDRTPALPHQVSIHLRHVRFHCRGTWKEETFKEYNFDALGLLPAGGHLHPLLKASDQSVDSFMSFSGWTCWLRAATCTPAQGMPEARWWLLQLRGKWGGCHNTGENGRAEVRQEAGWRWY